MSIRHYYAIVVPFVVIILSICFGATAHADVISQQWDMSYSTTSVSLEPSGPFLGQSFGTGLSGHLSSIVLYLDVPVGVPYLYFRLFSCDASLPLGQYDISGCPGGSSHGVRYGDTLAANTGVGYKTFSYSVDLNPALYYYFYDQGGYGYHVGVYGASTDWSTSDGYSWYGAGYGPTAMKDMYYQLIGTGGRQGATANSAVINSLWPINVATSTSPALGLSYTVSSLLYTHARYDLVDTSSGNLVYSSSTSVGVGSANWAASSSVSLATSTYQVTGTLYGDSLLVPQVVVTGTFSAGFDFGSLYAGNGQVPTLGTSNPTSWAGTAMTSWTATTTDWGASPIPLTSTGTTTDVTSLDRAWFQAAKWFNVVYLFQTKFPFSWAVGSYNAFYSIGSSTSSMSSAGFASYVVTIPGSNCHTNKVCFATSTVTIFSTTTISTYYTDAWRLAFRIMAIAVLWLLFVIGLWNRLTSVSIT